MADYAIPAAMLLLGLACHFLKDLARITKETGRPPRIWSYWRDYPYQSTLCIVGALAGYFALLETGQLSGLTAFGIGYMANSVADVIGNRATGRLQ